MGKAWGSGWVLCRGVFLSVPTAEYERFRSRFGEHLEHFMGRLQKGQMSAVDEEVVLGRLVLEDRSNLIIIPETGGRCPIAHLKLLEAKYEGKV